MNKISCNKKLFLAIGILFTVAVLFMVGPVSAAIFYPGTSTTENMVVPSINPANPDLASLYQVAPGSLLIDNFEYWDTPQNHGWAIQHPGMPGGYPVWGVGLGVGSIETVIDFQEGSRVLEAYMPATLFVPNIQRFTISYGLGVPMTGNEVLSVKMRSPVAVENFDTFEILVAASDAAGSQIVFRLIPRGATGAAITPVMDPALTATGTSVEPDPIGAPGVLQQEVVMSVGREVSDGSWHQICADLVAAHGIAGIPAMVAPVNILGIQISGNQYRMDDLMLMSSAVVSRIGAAPYLFHINHIYQQIYSADTTGPVGTGRYVFVSDAVGDAIYPTMSADGANLGNTMIQAQATYAQAVAANPALTMADHLKDVNIALWFQHKLIEGNWNAEVLTNPAYTDAAGVNEVQKIDPAITPLIYENAVLAYEAAISALVGAPVTLSDIKMQAVASGDPSAAVQPVTLAIGAAGANVTLPLVDLYTLDGPQLLDGVMASGVRTIDGGINMIQFTANVGGAHDLGACTGLINNVPISEIPPYIPLYGSSSLFPCCGDSANGFLSATQNNEIQMTQAALINAGYSVWPAIAKITIPPEIPQVMENLVLTVVASNGLAEDVEALTIITTNYAVTNYPPVIEDVDDQIFNIGQGPQVYQINATDADSFTHGINLQGGIVSTPAGQPTNDMDQLIWAATLNGSPSYAYGPWTDQLIDQKTGLVSFTPDFEGAYEMVVSVRDQDGAEAIAAFVINCIQGGTWLNHPPIMLGDWDHPMIGSAGKTLTLAFDGIVDPDGESLYYSCNIGTIGARAGVPVWEFSTMYPGTYMVEIVAYDTRGGYLVIPQEVIITPWWSM